MGKFTALGGALILLLGLALWQWAGRSTAYRFEPDRAVYHQFSGDVARAQVEKLVGFGPRPPGSENLEASRKYIEAQMTAFGWATVRQSFEEETPVGLRSFVNLRARFPGGTALDAVWERPTPVILGSHYDTKSYSDFEFVGANDSGSSTGALLEIARVTAKRPALASSLELVFFDGEEAFNPRISATDGLYGSRFYARHLRRSSPEQRPKFGLVLDMIGDRNLKVGVPKDSPFKLYQMLMKTAADLGYEQYFGQHDSAILDDHVPLNDIGIPTIDIIDFDYGPWHTAGDTMDEVSAKSLRIIGSTTLLLVEKYLLPEVFPP